MNSSSAKSVETDTSSAVTKREIVLNECFIIYFNLVVNITIFPEKGKFSVKIERNGQICSILVENLCGLNKYDIFVQTYS